MAELITVIAVSVTLTITSSVCISVQTLSAFSHRNPDFTVLLVLVLVLLAIIYGIEIVDAFIRFEHLLIGYPARNLKRYRYRLLRNRSVVQVEIH